MITIKCPSLLIKITIILTSGGLKLKKKALLNLKNIFTPSKNYSSQITKEL